MLVYNGMIVPTLMYGAESWVPKESEKQKNTGSRNVSVKEDCRSMQNRSCE